MNDEQAGKSTRPEGAHPKPDPTELTTDALQREIGHLRELLETMIDGVRLQMAENDRRYEERYQSQMQALGAASAAADRAVLAALDSSNRSVTKAEEAANKRADEVSRRVDDMKESTAREIGLLQTSIATRAGHGAGGAAAWGFLVGGIGVVVAIVTMILAFNS